MAVMLPGELVGLLHTLGFEWPEGNEDRVNEMADQWRAFATAFDAEVVVGESARDHVIGLNQGPALEAFVTAFNDVDSGAGVGHDLSEAMTIIGGCLNTMAAAIVILKIAVAIQLVLLAVSIASAIAAAVPTAGASASLIPLARIGAQLAINLAISLAVNTVMGE